MVSITSYSSNHIDAQMTVAGHPSQWRFTGFYGHPERHRRKDSWNLLEDLSPQSNQPWLLMGDFNDIRHPEEKRGRVPHPRWLMEGFNRVIEKCGLRDLDIEGYKFTWERGRGTPNWVEEKLDRILASTDWLEMFDNAKGEAAETPVSDHLPIILWPILTEKTRRIRRFRFENLWLKERNCRAIVADCWNATRGNNLGSRLGVCSKALWKWGRKFTDNLQAEINYSTNQMKMLRHRTDRNGIKDFIQAQRRSV